MRRWRCFTLVLDEDGREVGSWRLRRRAPSLRVLARRPREIAPRPELGPEHVEGVPDVELLSLGEVDRRDPPAAHGGPPKRSGAFSGSAAGVQNFGATPNTHNGVWPL